MAKGSIGGKGAKSNIIKEQTSVRAEDANLVPFSVQYGVNPQAKDAKSGQRRDINLTILDRQGKGFMLKSVKATIFEDRGIKYGLAKDGDEYVATELKTGARITGTRTLKDLKSTLTGMSDERIKTIKSQINQKMTENRIEYRDNRNISNYKRS